jgi:glycerophosphoryl diester phosphodiesterase
VLDRLLSLSEISAIAHRGGSRLRPENTMAAFDHAVALGAHGVECDVHLSRDGEPVIIHDDTVDRTTGATGAVAGFTAAELARLDAGYRFGAEAGHPFRGRGIGVPRLAELLERHPRLPVIIEIKGESEATAEGVLAVVRDAHAESRVIIAGFSQRVLDLIRRLAPEIPTSASQAEATAAIQGAAAGAPLRLGPFRLYQVPLRYNGQPAFDGAFVRAARDAGAPVQVWVVDDPEEMRQIAAWGVTGIISDRPDLALDCASR